ncbi:hypothetical protein B0H19DRAFT_575981 [Mycena capillaripes]|nr:hypothetical protein B0H19DRAFT_575981 [Mycena capillaripes]
MARTGTRVRLLSDSDIGYRFRRMDECWATTRRPYANRFWPSQGRIPDGSSSCENHEKSCKAT